MLYNLEIKEQDNGLGGLAIDTSAMMLKKMPISGKEETGNNANGVETDVTFDEYIHIVPIEVKKTHLVGNPYWGYGFSKEPGTNKIACYSYGKHVHNYLQDSIYPAMLKSGSIGNNKEIYDSNEYSGTTRIYKVFLKTSVLSDAQLKNNDIFEQCSSTIRKSETTNLQAQEKTSQKRIVLYGTDNPKSRHKDKEDTIYKTVTKIMYILKYGLNAKGVYENRIDAKGNIIKKGGKAFGLGTDNYKDLMGRSVHLLWSEYRYQLHRGVDFYYREGDPVYAICGGTVSKCDNNYSIYIRTYGYEPDKKEITVIYCHCNKDPNIKKDDPIYPGQLIGTVGRNAYYGKTPPHVHIEINPGDHKDKNITVHWQNKILNKNPLDITAEHVAINPYNYFFDMWEKYPE